MIVSRRSFLIQAPKAIVAGSTILLATTACEQQEQLPPGIPLAEANLQAEGTSLDGVWDAMQSDVGSLARYESLIAFKAQQPDGQWVSAVDVRDTSRRVSIEFPSGTPIRAQIADYPWIPIATDTDETPMDVYSRLWHLAEHSQRALFWQRNASGILVSVPPNTVFTQPARIVISWRRAA